MIEERATEITSNAKRIDVKSIVTIIVFFTSILFVIRPVSTPRFAFKINGWHFRWRIHINLTTAPLFAIALLWAAQCIGPGVIRDGIVGTEGVKPYNILILFFSLAYLSITVDITGVLQAAAFWVSNKGGSHGRRLYLYFYIMLTVISIIIGNDPVILSGTLFLVYYTDALGLKPISWLISEFAAANTASMVLFVGNPTNVVVCEGFGINNVAFTAYMIFPFLACSISCYVALILQFRGGEHIPPRLVATHLDPFSVLHDRVSAFVGGTMLGLCLIVIIVVSFYGVDVWMIALPFAFGKFIFDLVWDIYKHRHKPTPEEGPTLEEEVKREIRKQSTIHSPRLPNAGLTRAETKGRTPRSGASPGPTSDSGSPMIIKESLHRQNGHVLYEEATSETGGPSTPVLSASPQQQPKTLPEIEPPQTKQTDDSKTPDVVWDRVRDRVRDRARHRIPTIAQAFPRLPFALVPFAFSQFILIEALAHQGWIRVFANWLWIASRHGDIHAIIWIVGVCGVVLCNVSGTNIGATILLTKIMHDANLPQHTFRAGAIALAVATNIGAVSFTFSASLAGLLWKVILDDKKIEVRQWAFAKWNLFPIIVMTTVGLAVVSAEMQVLYKGVP